MSADVGSVEHGTLRRRHSSGTDGCQAGVVRWVKQAVMVWPASLSERSELTPACPWANNSTFRGRDMVGFLSHEGKGGHEHHKFYYEARRRAVSAGALTANPL